MGPREILQVTRIAHPLNLNTSTSSLTGVGNSFSSNQLKLDQIFYSFSSQATDLKNITSLSMAGFVGNLSRFGALQLLPGLSLMSLGLRNWGAQLFSIAAEAATLEGIHCVFESSPENPFLDSFFHSALTVGVFRFCAPLLKNQGFLLQQGIQASALVSSHRLSALFSSANHSEGESLSDEFMNALATNLSMGVGSHLSHRILGGKLQVLESQSHRLIEVANSRPKASQTLRRDLSFSSTAPARSIQDEIREQARYSNYLLQISLNDIVGLCLRKQGDRAAIRESLNRVKQIYIWTLEVWPSFVAEMNAVRLQEPFQHEALTELEKELRNEFSEQYHIHKQLSICLELLTHSLISEHCALEVRRRIEAVISRPGFQREIAWPVHSLATSIFYSADPTYRFEIGMKLLMRLHPNPSHEDMEVYRRAACGPVQDRHIAFDLDNTLGDLFQWHLAQDALSTSEKRKAYDGFDFDYFAHERSLMRLPLAHMQAALLGLWANGNTLKLYTHSKNLPGNHDAFFNDFPLLKVAFGLATPKNVFEMVTPEALAKSRHYMDESKRAEFQARHFGDAAGREFAARIFREAEIKSLEGFENTKIPFPDFYLDVLIDDSHYPSGEMQVLGFGKRFILAPRNGDALLDALEAYFAAPMPPISPTLQRWLENNERVDGGRVVKSETLKLRASADVTDPSSRSVSGQFLIHWALTEDSPVNLLFLSARAQRLSPALLNVLDYSIQLNPLLAKILFIHLNLLPARSPLREDIEVKTSLAITADCDWTEQELGNLARAFCRQYHANAHEALPSEAVIASWKNKLCKLSWLWIDFLNRDIFSAQEFNEIVESLGLTSSSH